MSQSDFVTRGQALVGAGQYQEAVKVCRLGLLGRPTTVEGRVVLGQALLALKRFDEVLAEMRVALELDATSIDAQILKAEALLKKRDAAGAVEVLQKVRVQAPTDGRVAALLAEAMRGNGKPRVSASHPAVGFVSPKPVHGDEEDGGSYTRPTSLAAPGAKKRTPQPLFSTAGAAKGAARGAMAGAMQGSIASPTLLAVGDHSGTHDIDPLVDGVDDEDDDELAAPPLPTGPRPALAGGDRGRVMPAGRTAQPGQPVQRDAGGTMELDAAELDASDLEADDDDADLDHETNGNKPAGRRSSAVRNAVRIPSGPLDAYLPSGGRSGPSGAPGPAGRDPRTAHHAGGAPPPGFAPMPGASPLAHLIANQPHAMAVSSLQPAPPYSIKAALPTAMAMPMPLPTPPHMSAAQEQSANVVDSLFAGAPSQNPAWAHSTMAAGGQAHLALTLMPYPLNPGGYSPPQAPHGYGQQPMVPQHSQHPHHYEAPPMMQAVASADPSAMYGAQPGAQSGDQDARQGPPADPQVGQQAAVASRSGRRGRSRLAAVVWVVLGGAMIGGGVFAGFKIRAVRLHKQITEARGEATALAKEDAWRGWVGARDRLASIARASGTLDNRAALARVRALVAFEFGDGYPEAKAAVDGLDSKGGLDGAIAATYLALADSDPKAARQAAGRAADLAPEDPAVLYLAGRVALLGGDAKTAIAKLEAAVKSEPRPLYAVGLARAQGETWAWDQALATLDPVLVAAPDLAAAVIERGRIMTLSGRIAATTKATTDIRMRLLKVVGEGSKAVNLQSTRGVSPSQVAYAYLLLARIDHARNESSQAHISNALVVTSDLGIDDQRFAEDVIDTLYAVGLLKQTRTGALKSLERWPQSRRVITTLAEVALAEGDPRTAVDQLAKLDLAAWPGSLAVRAAARASTGDGDGARADLETALKTSPGYEPALIGLAELELAAGEVDEARKRIEPRYKPASASPALVTVYAATLRASGDPKEVERARDLLLKVVAGPMTLDIPRAQLELARVHRALGEVKLARAAYAEAARGGNPDALLETATLLLDDRDAPGASQTLDQLVKTAGAAASPTLLLEAARAAMLVGNHIDAQAYLNSAAKLPDVSAWHLDRERARLFLRRGDYAGAAEALTRALDGCGPDAETFLLAAEVATAEDPPPGLADKVRSLAATRLKDQPEALIVAGKLAIAAGKLDDALVAFEAATSALQSANAPMRRQAQASYGRAFVLYSKQDDVKAITAFQLVTQQDPSLYAAYLYEADLIRATDGKQALALARQAVTLDGETVQGWYLVGVIAAANHDKFALEGAISQVNELAPNSEALVDLQQRQRTLTRP